MTGRAKPKRVRAEGEGAQGALCASGACASGLDRAVFLKRDCVPPCSLPQEPPADGHLGDPRLPAV